jgi:two-component system chemotaxis sensor kinase CheA
MPSRYLDLFLDEAVAHLGSAIALVAGLEPRPPESAVRELYRHAHSLKGLASTMGYGEMSRLAHAAEDVLEDLERGDRSVPQAIPELLSVLHAIERLVGEVDAWRDGPAGERPSSMERLDSLLPRLQDSVGDIASELGKSVELEMAGGHIRVRRGALGSIAVALVHLIRNAVDHGIELEDRRTADGKPAMGRVWIGAESSADAFVVVVEDDGRGLDTAALKRSAVLSGLVPAEQARELDDDAARRLATCPGLTTRERTTELSGRGFGLAVVRGDVEALGGSLRLGPRPGGGTRVEMHLPVRLCVEHPRGRPTS